EIHGYYTTSGAFVNSSLYRTTGMVEINEGELIYATAASLVGTPALAPIVYFDQDQNFISFSYTVGNNVIVFPPVGTKYIALSQNNLNLPKLKLLRYGSKGRYLDELSNIPINAANNTANTF